MNDLAKNVLHFYRVSDEHGYLSNFAPFPIDLNDKIWPTAEHYFQAQKFLSLEHQEEIRLTESPMIAARMGRDRNKPLRSDWESIKISVMTEALRAKFVQHVQLEILLIATGDLILVEHTKNDAYWGDGGDGRGKNMLGILLMQIRDELRLR